MAQNDGVVLSRDDYLFAMVKVARTSKSSLMGEGRLIIISIQLNHDFYCVNELLSWLRRCCLRLYISLLFGTSVCNILCALKFGESSAHRSLRASSDHIVS